MRRKDGTIASSAPRWRAPIQSKDGQAMAEAEGRDLIGVMGGRCTPLDLISHRQLGRFHCDASLASAEPSLTQQAKKKPTWSNIQRNSTTSAYSSTGPPE